jgi:hypothetical protein
MNWLFSKSIKQAATNKRSATVDSIRQKLADYRPTAGKSVFIGPAMAHEADFYEYEKVAINPESSMTHQVPFTC